MVRLRPTLGAQHSLAVRQPLPVGPPLIVLPVPDQQVVVGPLALHPLPPVPVLLPLRLLLLALRLLLLFGLWLGAVFRRVAEEGKSGGKADSSGVGASAEEERHLHKLWVVYIQIVC